jgi:transcriptional regulator GlxA family with amidase domain
MDSRVATVIEIMNQQSASRLSSQVIFDAVNLSRGRLRVLFKQETGLSPQRYMKLIRLEKAAYLLCNSFLSIKEVMFKCGIMDASHFVRDFKKQFGATPREFRAKSQRSQKHIRAARSEVKSANK